MEREKGKKKIIAFFATGLVWSGLVWLFACLLAPCPHPRPRLFLSFSTALSVPANQRALGFFFRHRSGLGSTTHSPRTNLARPLAQGWDSQAEPWHFAQTGFLEIPMLELAFRCERHAVVAPFGPLAIALFTLSTLPYLRPGVRALVVRWCWPVAHFDRFAHLVLGVASALFFSLAVGRLV